MKQLQSAAKNYVPLIVGALQAGPNAATTVANGIQWGVNSGLVNDPEDIANAPNVVAVVSTAGAAAATAAPYVSAAAPYVVPVGGDAVLLNGVIKEVQSGMSGQCTW
jgi:hypothetical protein